MNKGSICIHVIHQCWQFFISESCEALKRSAHFGEYDYVCLRCSSNTSDFSVYIRMAWCLYCLCSLHISSHLKKLTLCNHVLGGTASFLSTCKNCGPRVAVHRVNIPSKWVNPKSSQLQNKNPSKNQFMLKL